MWFSADSCHLFQRERGDVMLWHVHSSRTLERLTGLIDSEWRVCLGINMYHWRYHTRYSWNFVAVKFATKCKQLAYKWEDGLVDENTAVAIWTCTTCTFRTERCNNPESMKKWQIMVGNITKYTANQRLLLSANTEFLHLFFMFANTSLHVMSQSHEVTSTLIAIQ